MSCGVKFGDCNIGILLYADDVALISENEQNMQNMINCVYKWCMKWKMKVNLTKSKIMHFRKKNMERSKFMFLLGFEPLEYVKHYKYLGIYFDEVLDFTFHAETLAGSGQRALGALVAKYKSYNDMTWNTYKKIYESCILSVLTYGAEIWGYSTETKTVLVQNKAMRIFLGVNKNAANLAIIGNLAWTPQLISKKLCMLQYCNRLIQMDNNRLTKQVFLESYKKNGKWCKVIRNVLKEINMVCIYENKNVCNIDMCRDKLIDNFTIFWKKGILKKTKLRTYCTIKSNFELEKYVSLNLLASERSVLSQLYFGTLPLEIELGRYSQTPLDNRKCKICKSGIEDEIHFIFLCPAYVKERDKFFKDIELSQCNSDSVNLKYMIDCYPRKLSKYILKLLELRRSRLT